MADFVVPRHSAVMERLRRRIELFRRHHNSCEKRYDNTTMERLELERQQTFALHQRCLQTKAKRSNKHRQPQSATDQAAQRVSGTGASSADLADSGAPGEQSRNSTLIALQETVKRKLENAGSPLGREQVNGFGDAYPPSKKSCLEESLGGMNGASNGAVPPLSPLESKHGVTADARVLNGSRAPEANGAGRPDVRGAEPDLRLKQEMKQEPMDDILPTGGGNGNIILPDLNLNEQEWTELMEEFNRSVPYEEIQELFNDGFDDRKDSEGTPSGTAAVAATGLLPPDLVKAEFSPVAAASFEQDSRTGSPQVPSGAAGPQLHAGSPAAAPSAASSPALPVPQAVQTSRQGQVPQAGQTPRPLQSHLLPGPPKDLSPAQQLQQLAAREQQRTQRMQSQQKQQKQQQQQQQQQQQPPPKFHQQPSHPSAWPQSAPAQSPLGGAFALEKPASPSLYPQDFQNPKSLLMAGQQPSKGSPKAGAPGGFMQPGGHPMLAHPTAPSGALGHPPGAGGQSAMLDYSNTKPLSHFEAGAPGQPRGPAAPAPQNKAALLTILRQQQMKQRPTAMPFRPPAHMAHAQQEPGTYPSAPHVPGNGNAMATQPGAGGGSMGASHSNAAYLSGLQKQQQMQMMSSQQKQFILNQHRQMMAEQEKQRQQQEQQLQRHLTRPPPQYQDQQNPSAPQNPFQPQPQVSQFSGSSQPIGGVNSLGGPSPAAQRMFTQTQGMMGLSQGGGPATGAQSAASQADMSLPSCAGGLDVQQVLYGNMPMHPSHPNQQRMPMSASYRQNVLAQQAHLKSQPNAALLKQQQQLARLPNSMPNSLVNISAAMPSSMTGSIQGAMPPQAQSWQQQQPPHPGLQQGMGGQPNPSNGFPGSSFHMQARMPKLPGSGPFAQAGMGNGAAARAMPSMNPGQMMSSMAQQRTSNAGMGQQLPPPNQQQAPQGQPPPQPQQVLPDLGPFGQPQGGQVPNRTASMQCNQAYQVNRPPSQQLPFGYSTQPAGSMSGFPGETDLVDSLLKNQTTQEWMDDLDELLASHQ
ncbi:mastermind-like protein 1 isoform X1 [Electrophorus electricus]|uniref:Neurogenic mastermind-like N-terminal domain-containing protein n=1 Tax=Electrophorus electricus TaxID=8005 RepID=A0A4W4HQ68_ELEEL|nr:mastermind-like protein 1 isoform X1 [Electrophorus electricus]